MNAYPDDLPARVRQQIETLAVGELPEQELTRTVEAVLLAVQPDPSGAYPAWESAVDCVLAGFDLRAAAERAKVPEPPPRACCRTFARDLFAAVHEMLGWERDDRHPPPNPFQVHRTDKHVVWFHDGRHFLPVPDALMLACWLIALADPGLKQAPQQLLAVSTR